MSRDSRRGIAFLSAVAVSLTAAVALGSGSAPRALKLKVQDAVAAPGGRTALVVRTYEPGALSEGQLSFVFRPRGEAPASGPIAAVDGVELFGEGSREIEVVLSESRRGQRLVIRFGTSGSGLNQRSGPLAVV